MKPARRRPTTFNPHISLSPRATRERRQILADGRAALHQRQRADAHELMHEAVAGNERAVMHRHMAAEQRAVRDDDVVAQLAIVADMAIRHQKIVRADDRFPVRFGRAMHRDVFAENIVVADAQPRRFALVFQILRRVADDAAGVKLIVRADFCFARQINMRPDNAMRAKFHARVNHGIRPDLDRRVQLRFRMDDGGLDESFFSHRFAQIEHGLKTKLKLHRPCLIYG